MNPHNDEEVLRREYLLGRLSEQAREQVEERLLGDGDFVEKLSTTEDTLIDDYVFGTLSASDRRSFESHFVINDERRRKIQFAQSLDLYLEKLDSPLPLTPTEAAPWWETPLKVIRSYKFWVAVPALVLLIVFAPRLYRWLQPHDQIAFVQAHRARIERQIAEFNKSNDQSFPAQELVLDQSSGLREGGGIKRLTLAPDTKTLTLKLAVSSSTSQQSYRALVATVEGTELFGIDDLKQENESGHTFVRLKIPTEFLDTGDYQVQLGGVGSDAQLINPVRYYFGVLKQH